MYDYDDKIKAFIQQNFTPATADNANVKLTTNGLLKFLWNAFPEECISDYTLVEILESLGYQQTMYVVEHYTKVKTENKKFIEVKKSLQLGWYFKSQFDLRPTTIEDLSEDDDD